MFETVPNRLPYVMSTIFVKGHEKGRRCGEANTHKLSFQFNKTLQDGNISEKKKQAMISTNIGGDGMMKRFSYTSNNFGLIT